MCFERSILSCNTQVRNFFNLFGALHGMQSTKGLKLVEACTLVTLKSGAKFIMHVNQGLFDLNPLQMESLLQPYQARANGVTVDDVCKRHKGMDGHPGTQYIYVDGHELPIHFDGLKQFLCVLLPTDADVLCYPSVVLTSPEPYETVNFCVAWFQLRLTLKSGKSD